MKEETQMQKLDSFSKILLATQTINYMAHTLCRVNEALKRFPDHHAVISEGNKDREEVIKTTLKKLSDIMEELGNVLNNYDCTLPIDERVTKGAFEIVIHGKDNVTE